uniref:Replication factor A 1, rfa1, putative n=1 Tax=Arundo donax TaxID=35708 RepID=A0A0A9E528_ARUDO
MLRCSTKLIYSHGIWIRNSKFGRHYWIPNNLTLWNKNFHVQHDERPIELQPISLSGRTRNNLNRLSLQRTRDNGHDHHQKKN